MKNFFIGAAVAALVAIGIFAFTHKTQPQQQVAGASAGPDHFNQEYFHNGLALTKAYDLGAVSASTTTTTVVSVALVNGTNGQITLGTSTPATNTMTASTTAITLNSMVTLRQNASTTIPGVTCNSTPTTTPIVTVYASTTDPLLNGFTLTSAAIPATHPLCYDYSISDHSTGQ